MGRPAAEYVDQGKHQRERDGPEHQTRSSEYNEPPEYSDEDGKCM
jgi:hypothetical protein